jgi:hypothetical protein
MKQFKSWLMKMLESGDTASLGADMALRSPYCEEAFGRCLDALETGWIEPTLFGMLQYGRALDSVPAAQVERLLRLIHERATPAAMQLLIGLLDSFGPDQPLPCGADFVFVVARQTIPSSRHQWHSFGFHWKRVCSRLVKSDIALAAPLLDAILTAMGGEYELSYDHNIEELSKELVGADPERAWQIIARQFEATLPKWRSDLYSWLKGGIHSFGEGAQRAPIVDLPVSSILSWIEFDPNERAALIAHAVPPTLDDGGGGGLTRQLLTRFGHIEGVCSGISASFHSGSWTGLTSQYLKRKRDNLRRWLIAGFDFQVTQWIELEVERIDQDIQREEIDEERDRFE